jgi:hypothetical protein
VRKRVQQRYAALALAARAAFRHVARG